MSIAGKSHRTTVKDKMRLGSNLIHHDQRQFVFQHSLPQHIATVARHGIIKS